MLRHHSDLPPTRGQDHPPKTLAPPPQSLKLATNFSTLPHMSSMDSSLDIAKRRAGGDEIVPDLEMGRFLQDISPGPTRRSSSVTGSWKDRYQQIARSRASSVGSKSVASSAASSPASAYLSRINSRLSINQERRLQPLAQEVGFDENHSYKLGPVLGKGGFSVVRRAVRNDDKVVALKIIDKRAGDIDQEVQIWRQLDHPHILKLLAVHETHASYYLVTGFFPEGSLFDLIRNNRQSLPIPQIKQYLLQLVDAVGYMHSLKILHRDIKPENCLVDPENGLLLCDFGLSEYADSAISSSTVGPALSSAATPNTATALGGSFLFASPELLDGIAGYASDVWALGVVFYLCLTGTYPWQHGLLPKLKQMIKGEDYDETKLPTDSRRVIQECLRKDWEKRPTVKRIKEMLYSSWGEIG